MPSARHSVLNSLKCTFARGETMSYNYTKAYSQYGASMGRPDHISEAETVDKIHLERVVLNTGGYDLGGAYWGHGAPLYVAYGDGAEEV